MIAYNSEYIFLLGCQNDSYSNLEHMTLLCNHNDSYYDAILVLQSL